MVSGRAVTTEQGQSLVHVVADAGHRHGDESLVTLKGVGVSATPAGVHLAFCPAAVSDHQCVAQASAEIRQQPMPLQARLSRGAKRVLRQSFGTFHGFASIRCRVHSNGKLHLRDIKVISIQPHNGQINFANSYEAVEVVSE